MTLRSRLLLFGIPLMVLPLAASLVVFSYKMAETDHISQFRVLEARLSLVETHIESTWAVLSRAGFDNSEFYQRSVSSSVTDILQSLHSPGESILVINSRGVILEGPPGMVGQPIGEKDPWHILLETSAGHRILSSPSLTAGRPFLLTYRRFVPWDWTLVTAADEGLVWDAVAQGVFLAILGSLVFLGAAVVGFWLLARHTARPLVELQTLASRMGQGRFDLRARAEGPAETVTLAREWNAMAARVEELTTGLEQRVAERTHDLSEALEQTKRIQKQLVLSEKMASLGQLVAGIAHELNTPLGAILSAQRTLEEVLGDRRAAALETMAALSFDDRRRVLSWLDRVPLGSPPGDSGSRRRLRRDLASQLEAAGVLEPEEAADTLFEVGLVCWDPGDLVLLAGEPGRALVSAVADLALARVSSSLVGLAASKADRVIHALRIYSHNDPHWDSAAVSVAESFDNVLTLYQASLKLGVEVVRNLPDDLKVRADSDRLGQLWSNLVSNALGAMSNHGRLELTAFRDGDQVVVQVADSGPGIAPEVHAQIFTPFFTTKKAGEGSGLGLSICQTIVQEAGGTLTFHSVPGRTVFEARFPCP